MFGFLPFEFKGFGAPSIDSGWIAAIAALAAELFKKSRLATPVFEFGMATVFLSFLRAVGDNDLQN
jgi:hypothetical protein